MKQKSYLYLIFMFSMVIWTSCIQNNEEEYDVPENVSPNQLFHLTAFEFGGTETRARELPVTGFDRLDYYVCYEDGSFVTNIKHIYHPEKPAIHIANLKDGEYKLCVLAVKGDYEADGASIFLLAGISIEEWLTVSNSSRPLQADYYYAEHLFNIENGVVSEPDVSLQHVSGKVDFHFDWKNDYVRNSVEEIEIIPKATTVYTSMGRKGIYSGSALLEPMVCYGDSTFLLMPNSTNSTFEGEIRMKFVRHNGEKTMQSYRFSTIIRANERSIVHVDVKHPDDNSGMLYVTAGSYTSDNFYRILQDDESPSVYYDRLQRSFNINQPLQVNTKEGNKLHIRFYSPVEIKGASIFAKFPGESEEVELAWFHHVPAFADAVFDLPAAGKEVVYKTPGGIYKKIRMPALTNTSSLITRIESEDPYWQKIKKIQAKWNIRFSSYGGDPIKGTTNGNWGAIRPVYIRESIAIWTNIAYMCTMDSFKEFVMGFNGRFTNNNGGQVPASSIIPQMQKLTGFNIGIVRGAGVAGLGGGETWGVWSSSFINHYKYSDQWGTRPIFHEMGHCMGYNHSSSMTYGVFSEGCCNVFYVRHINELPVNSPDILKSRNNPNLY